MPYRTKIYNKLKDYYLKPIMDFIGIARSDDSGCGLLKYVGCDKRDRETGEITHVYFTNTFNNDKIFTLIDSQDELMNFRSRRENLDYFNPFVKSKNTIMLLLMTAPVIYEKVHIQNSDTDEDLVNSIIEDELDITQEDILNTVKIKQYPIEKSHDSSIYKFEAEINYGEDNSISIITTSTEKIVAILMLIINIMCKFDNPPDRLVQLNNDFDAFEEEMMTLLEKYSKERELNRKDIKKIKIEKDVDVYTDSELEAFDPNSDDDLVDVSAEEIKSNTDDATKAIDFTNIYRDAIPIIDKESDDDIVDIEYI